MTFRNLKEFFARFRSQQSIRTIPTDGTCGVCGEQLPLGANGYPVFALNVSAELGLFDGKKVNLLEIKSDEASKTKVVCLQCAVTAAIAYNTFDTAPMLAELGKRIDTATAQATA